MGVEGLENALPFAGMVIVVLLQVINMVVCKEALSQGFDKYVLVVYSGALSTLLLSPFPFIFHRSASHRPRLTLRVLCGFIVLSGLGSLGGICENAGMLYSSPTLGTALLNLTPAFTFILAFIFRMEKLKWRSSSSIAKVGGTIVSIGGAFIVTFYKGPQMMNSSSSSLLTSSFLSPQPNWILGGFFLTTEAFTLSAGYIIQTFILKKFPALLLVMIYTFIFATTFSTIAALMVVKDSTAWRLRLDMGLVAIVCSAVTSLLRYGLVLLCLRKTGPLFISMFKPLAIIFSGVISVLLMKDILCLGSVIGAATIVGGFYAVMWGKAKEKESEVESLVVSVSSTNKVPLLQNRTQQGT